MQKWKLFGMIVASFAIFLLISPVAACTTTVISNTCAGAVCPACEMTCTIVVQFEKDTGAGYTGTVTDTLPAAANYISSSDSGSSATSHGPVTWSISVPKGSGILQKTLTVTFNPPISTYFTTTATSMNPYHTSTAVSSTRVTVPPCIVAPEFPTVFLPAIMIIGFLGAVLCIRKTKEN